MENPGCSKARRSSLPANTNDRPGCSLSIHCGKPLETVQTTAELRLIRFAFSMPSSSC